MRLLLSLIGCCVFQIASSQEEVRTYSLSDCISYALENSPLNKASDIRQRQSIAEVQLKKSEFLPRLNAYSDYRQYFDNTTYIFPSEEGSLLSNGASSGPYPIRLGQRHNLFAGVNISQVVFDKRWLYSGEFNLLTADLQELAVSIKDEEIIYAISTIFLEISKWEANLNLLEQANSQLVRLKGIAELQVNNDILKTSDVERLHLKLYKQEIDIERLKNNIVLLRDRLKYLLGMESTVSLELTQESISIDIDSNNPVGSTKSRLIEKKEALGKLQIRSTADKYFPTLKAYGDLQFQAQRSSFNFTSGEKWFPQHYLGVGLNFPILTGFEKKAKVALEQIKLEEIQLEREMLINEESHQIKNAQINLRSAQDYLDHSERAMQLSQVLYREVEQEYNEGISSLRDLILTSTEQIQAGNQYEDALFEYKLAQINYLKATSSLKTLIL